MSKKIKPIWKHGQLDPKSPNKTFCMAPWTHTYISPQSERRICCASREDHDFQKQYIDKSWDDGGGNDYNPKTLKEHWNSDYMKNIRKKLMAGETIPQCQVCNEQELSLSTYRQWFTGALFPNYIDKAFDSTDDDGHTTMEPISFDYRLSNHCNFKCRMCGEQLSSSWEAEKRKHNLWSAEQDPWMKDENREKIKKFEVEVVEQEFRDAVNRGIVEEIYWVGGEPLMWPVHWEVLDQMVKEDTAKHCYLRYNSNLSRVEFQGVNLYKQLPHFKNWIMCASIDGIGEIGEFIRTGLDWKQWDKNFRQGCELDNTKMKLDLTITGPGMFGLKDLFDYAQELDVEILTKIMFAFHADIVFSPFAWPREILDEVIDDNLAYIEPRATEKQMSLVHTLKEMKTRPTFQEKYSEEVEEAFKNGKAWQDKLREIRNDRDKTTIEDIYSQNKRLIDWWTRYE
jgi:hypothetical protein|tara:strand:- start:492 stop:1853 length:1362 start_codon:yes stop_codon:yes gene_type:complete